jgi:hypothetical protein
MTLAGADEFAAEMWARADISALPAVRQAHEGFHNHFGQFWRVRQKMGALPTELRAQPQGGELKSRARAGRDGI